MLSDSLLCMIGSSAEESMRLQLLACRQVCVRYIEAPACLAVSHLHFSSVCHVLMTAACGIPYASKGRKQVNIVQAKQGGSVPNRSKE